MISKFLATAMLLSTSSVFANTPEFNFKDVDPLSYYQQEDIKEGIDLRSKAQKDFASFNENNQIDLEQTLAPDDYYTLEELRETLKGTKSFYIPLDINKKNLAIFAATTSIGLVLFKNDQEIMDYVQDTKSQTVRESADYMNDQVPKAVPVVALGSYFLGITLKNGELKQAGLIAITGGLATGLVTQAFKYTFGRKRPNQDAGPYDFFNPGHHSFFSGHTSSAFSLATAIAEVYGDKNKAVPYLAYGAAAFAAYARMYDNKHWASDVFYGAIAGHLVTKLAANYFRSPDYAKGLSVYPAIGEYGDFQLNVHYQKRPKPRPFKCVKFKDPYMRAQTCFYEAFLRS
ncbi:MAG: phosphatase PAP2 family protein, partial [Bacteriovoracaceae bacterium]|nr:phosphatase PAP2 family protein [Bacteriovoracaceae bacterium]